MNWNNPLIVEEQRAVDEREVEGLLMICKEMSERPRHEQVMLMAIPFNPAVVAEARRRTLG
jgi:hypothetical protein